MSLAIVLHLFFFLAKILQKFFKSSSKLRGMPLCLDLVRRGLNLKMVFTALITFHFCFFEALLSYVQTISFR